MNIQKLTYFLCGWSETPKTCSTLILARTAQLSKFTGRALLINIATTVSVRVREIVQAITFSSVKKKASRAQLQIYLVLCTDPLRREVAVEWWPIRGALFARHQYPPCWLEMFDASDKASRVACDQVNDRLLLRCSSAGDKSS